MITHTHVFYTDPKNGWCEMHLDADDYQVGEALYHYRKSDAIKSAKRMKLPLHVFGKNGLLQQIA